MATDSHQPTPADDLFLRDEGAGPPVVLVHAGVADGRMWEPQIAALSDRYRLVVPDLRGFGRTPTPDNPFSHGDDLRELAARRVVGPATWIGCSMGGTAVLDLALAAPEMVSALVLIDAVPSGYRIDDPIVRAGWAAAEEAFFNGELDRAADLEMAMWLVGPDRSEDSVSAPLRSQVRDMIRDSYEHPDGEEIDPSRPAMEHLEEVAVPTLVVVGEHDHEPFRMAATLMADRIPGATLEVIGRAAHLPSLERPGVFNDLLNGFLSSSRP